MTFLSLKSTLSYEVMKLASYKKPIRRANPKELNWIYKRLSDALETRNIVFSVEKILSDRVLLHVRHENELFSVYLKFNGRFVKPSELSIDDYVAQ